MLVILNGAGVPASQRCCELLVHTTVKMLENCFKAKRNTVKEKKRVGDRNICQKPIGIP